MNSEIIVIKLNPQHKETWRYSGEVLQRTATSVLIEAFFNRDDLPFHGITLGRGDRFVEIYYTNRWYNIFEIYNRDDGSLRGWYCNVTRPAIMLDNEIHYVDLALDLLVYPDGRQLVLDEDEFAALKLPPTTRRRARLALVELQTLFSQDPPHLDGQKQKIVR